MPCSLGPWGFLVLMWGCVWLSAAAPAEIQGPGPAPPNAVRPRAIEIRGRVVCVPEELHRQHGAELPTAHAHLWGFKSADGPLYTLLRTKFSEAIFMDEQVRAKELLLRARVFPKTQVLEVAHLHSIRDGVEQDLYYYCDVCSIKSVSPEICACCQQPVRLVEKPLTDKSE